MYLVAYVADKPVHIHGARNVEIPLEPSEALGSAHKMVDHLIFGASEMVVPAAEPVAEPEPLDPPAPVPASPEPVVAESVPAPVPEPEATPTPKRAARKTTPKKRSARKTK